MIRSLKHRPFQPVANIRDFGQLKRSQDSFDVFEMFASLIKITDDCHETDNALGVKRSYMVIFFIATFTRRATTLGKGTLQGIGVIFHEWTSTISRAFTISVEWVLVRCIQNGIQTDKASHTS